MYHIIRPSKTVVTSGGDSSKGTGYAAISTVDKDPSEWTESERDFMAGRDPKTAPLERRITYLESQLRRIAHGDWQSPVIDSESANTYAQIKAEMQNIAALALTAIVSEA